MNEPVPVSGAVPPRAETVTVVEPPLQAMVPADEEAVKDAGWDNVPPVVVEHPFASVTV